MNDQRSFERIYFELALKRARRDRLLREIEDLKRRKQELQEEVNFYESMYGKLPERDLEVS